MEVAPRYPIEHDEEVGTNQNRSGKASLRSIKTDQINLKHHAQHCRSEEKREKLTHVILINVCGHLAQICEVEYEITVTG